MCKNDFKLSEKFSKTVEEALEVTQIGCRARCRTLEEVEESMQKANKYIQFLCGIPNQSIRKCEFESLKLFLSGGKFYAGHTYMGTKCSISYDKEGTPNKFESYREKSGDSKARIVASFLGQIPDIDYIKCMGKGWGCRIKVEVFEEFFQGKHLTEITFVVPR